MARWSGERGVDALLTLAIGSSALSLALSKYQSRAPYGRFGKPNKHISIDPRLGWLLMELPASVCFAYGFRRGLAALRARAAKEAGRPAPARPSGSLVRAVLCALWARHYLNRGFYFPLTIRVAEGGQASFALFNSAIGAVFVGIHGYLNGRAFSDLGGYTDAWLTDPRFLLGAAIYEAGFWTILHSEHTLKNLRPAGQVVSVAERYKIPYGGMFKYVTSPQYLGEITAWTGFLMLTCSPTAIPVLLITLANLVPRAFENHNWYIDKFKGAYPVGRTALIPFLA